MLAKITYIDIGNKKYPMSFSLSSAKKMEGLAKISKSIDKGSADLVSAASMLSEILYVMIYTGCMYCNAMYFPPYDGAPIENGKFVPIKKENLEYLIPLEADDLKEIVNKIKECVFNGKKRELKAVPNRSSKKKKTKH